MGYYTTYSLTVENKGNLEYEGAVKRYKDDEAFIEDFLDKNYIFENTKWYEHDDDMKKVSNNFKNVVFILDGEGEEQGDVWRKYYFNGEVKEVRAKMVFDDPYANSFGLSPNEDL